MKKDYKYKIISYSPNRQVHESKKKWLETQGIFFGGYDLKSIPKSYEKHFLGLDFYWCFDNPETALMFKLKWGEDK